MVNQLLIIQESVVIAVLKIVLLVSVGIKLELQKVLDSGKRKCLSGLAMDICLPCLLFASVLPMAEEQLLIEGWPLLLWPFVYAPVGAILGAACCFLVRIPFRHMGSAAACAAFPNINGFPVSIISALDFALPSSPNGFSAMTFLSLIQLTDGVLKYTIGPAVFKLDKYNQSVRRANSPFSPNSNPSPASSELDDGGELQVGDSLRSFDGVPPIVIFDEDDEPTAEKASPRQSSRKLLGNKSNSLVDFGLLIENVRTVVPDWTRADSYMLFRERKKTKTLPDILPSIQEPLLVDGSPEVRDCHGKLKAWADLFREIMPPQVLATILALAIGVGPEWVKELFIPIPGRPKRNFFGFMYGAARQLGGGFVPMQMISLGGRLVNIASSSGPLSASGSVGPRGRKRLLRISAAVAVARMVLAPAACYCIVLLLGRYMAPRPLAFWAPVVVVTAMPTANNMSTMADLIGSGRSISAASTAMQLLASPVILAVSLTLLIAGAEEYIAVH